MNRSAILAVFLLGLTGAITAVPAFADATILYNNITSNSYQTNAIGIIADYYTVTDSFTFSQTSTITGVNLGLWLAPNSNAQTVTWQITQTPFGFGDELPIDGGTANVSSSTNKAQLDGADVDLVTFNISDMQSLGPGTYYFELLGVTTDNPNGVGVGWDESDGPSVAYADYVAYGPNGVFGPSPNSQSFQILGEEDTTVTPEPSSFLLLGSGLAALCGLIKSKLAA